MGQPGSRPLRTRPFGPAPAQLDLQAGNRTGSWEPPAPRRPQPTQPATRPRAGLVLLLVSPFIAEFVPGNQYLAGSIDVAQQAAMFIVFILFYGCATVVIREVSRRAGRGWPTIIALALALALIEEGVLAQSLFNPKWAGLDLLSYGHVPGLDTGAPWALYVLAIHMVWSVAVPIALVEAVFPRNGAAPWLSAKALTGATLGLLTGSILIFDTSTTDFMASSLQLSVCILGAAGAIWAAFRWRQPIAAHRARSTGAVPAVVAALFFTSAFQEVMRLPPRSAPLTCVLLSASLVGWVVLLRRFAWSPYWSALGALGTYIWFGLTQVGILADLTTGDRGRFFAQALTEQVVVALCAAALGAHVAWRLLKHGRHIPGSRSTMKEAR